MRLIMQIELPSRVLPVPRLHSPCPVGSSVGSVLSEANARLHRSVLPPTHREIVILISFSIQDPSSQAFTAI
jgi:hypothetical protein